MATTGTKVDPLLNPRCNGTSACKVIRTQTPKLSLLGHPSVATILYGIETSVDENTAVAACSPSAAGLYYFYHYLRQQFLELRLTKRAHTADS